MTARPTSYAGSRHRRAVTAAVLGCLAVLGISVPPAQAAELSDAGADAFAELSACVAGTDRLVASIVVDESASLKSTDPDDQRVGAVEVAVDTLAALEATGAEVDTELAVFGEDYTQLVDWGSPSGRHGERLRRTIEDDLPARKEAQHTDYRAALSGAQASIDEQQARADGDSCSAVLWFTDGKLDVGVDGADPADEVARDELCTPGGIVDGIRDAGTTVVALALFAEGDDTVSPKNRDQLRAVAEGSGKDATCGTVPIPDDAAGGAYLRADQPSALRRLFSGAGALLEGYTPVEDGTFTCPQDCPVPVHADAAVDSFRVVFELEDGAGAVGLTAPDGTAVEMAEGTEALGDSTVTTSENDGLYVTDVVPGTSGIGEWAVDGDAATVVDLYYRWGATVDVAPQGDAEGLVIGEENTVVLTPRSADGSVADPDLFAAPVDLTATVDGDPVAATPRDDGTFTVQVPIPVDGAPSEVEVSVTATATSAPHRVDLGPVVSTVNLPTTLPATYPTIAPTRLELPRTTAEEPATATLGLTGPDDGETRACFGTPAVEGPSDAGAVTLAVDGAAAPDGCVDLPAGGTASVPVTLTAATAADGNVTGTLPVTLTGANGGDEITLEVPVSGSLYRPVDEGERWGLTALFLLIAIGLAWAVAAGGRHLADRYPLGEDLRYARVPVTVGPGGVRRRDGGRLLTPDDFRPAHAGRNKASFSVAGLAFDRRGPWWWPWTPLQGRVTAQGAVVLTGIGTPGHRLDAAGTAAPVKFPGTQHLYLLPAVSTTAAPDELEADLVLLVQARNGSTARSIDTWTAELNGYPQWPELTDEAHSAIAAREQARTEDTIRSRRRGRVRRRPDDGRTAATTATGTSEQPPAAFGGSSAEDGGPPSPFDRPSPWADRQPEHRGGPGGSSAPPGGSGTGPSTPPADDHGAPPPFNW